MYLLPQSISLIPLAIKFIASFLQMPFFVTEMSLGLIEQLPALI